MKDEFKRAAGKRLGIGGMKCACCGPAPKHRKAFRRAVRARLAEDTRRVAREEG